MIFIRAQSFILTLIISEPDQPLTNFTYRETIVRFKMIDDYGLKGALISHLLKNLYETRQCLEVFFYQTTRQERLLVEYLRELNLEYF